MAVGLDFNGILVISLVLIQPAASQSVTVWTDLACFPCQLGRETLVYFQEGSQHFSENCSENTAQLLSIVFVRARKGFMHEQPDQLLKRQVFSFEI